MRTLGIALAALLLAGCQSGPIRLNDGGAQRVQASDIISVALDDSGKNRLEPYHSWTGPSRYPVDTGEVWRRVFIGQDSSPVFTIIHSELREHVESLGFASRYTYSVEGELTHKGLKYPIRSSGDRAAAVNVISAMRQAVELAVVDAARQCRAIISAKGE